MRVEIGFQLSPRIHLAFQNKLWVRRRAVKRSSEQLQSVAPLLLSCQGSQELRLALETPGDVSGLPGVGQRPLGPH